MRLYETSKTILNLVIALAIVFLLFKGSLNDNGRFVPGSEGWIIDTKTGKVYLYNEYNARYYEDRNSFIKSFNEKIESSFNRIEYVETDTTGGMKELPR